MAEKVPKNREENKAHRIASPVRLRVMPVKEEFIGQRLLTIKDAARYLGRGEDSLREMIYAGIFPVIQVGERSKIWLDLKDLDDWVEHSKEFMRRRASGL